MAEIEYNEQVLKVFKEDEIKDKSKITYRLVKWGKNPPIFEVRMFYKDKEGNWKPGKLRALDKERLQWVKEHCDEIVQELDDANKTK